MTRRDRPSYFDSHRPRVEVIPMIDIMMFLLVFFVVITLKMIAGTGVEMDLPRSSTTQEMKSSTITIGVTRAAIGIHRLGATVFAAARRGSVVPMDRADVVAVAAVFHLEFPVAVVGVGGVAAQHLQAMGCLVCNLVDHHFGLTQKVLQGLHVRIQATEQKAFVAFKTGNLFQAR